jgi:signal peptidase II
VSGRVLLILAVLCTSVGCDQATKVVAQGALKGAAPQSYLADTFRLTYAENPGAFLSMGAHLPEGVRSSILTVGVGLLLVAALMYLFSSRKLPRSQVVALALVVGGGIGNLIDRLVHGGVVVDFMNLGIGSLRTGIFNVADVQIMAGACALALLARTRDPPKIQPS